MARVIRHTLLDEALADHLQAPHWYVAFSGGVDSTALLQLLNQWCRAHKDAPPLSAVHVNHGIQDQATEWENHCAWICRFLNVPFSALRAEVSVRGKGLESAAREARYACFEEQLGKGELLFLGHHLDDQVETFFLRLLRGAGVEGLAAMPRERELGRGRLLRPLLDTSRSQLQAYAEAQGLRWIDDPSNAGTSQDRNYLRHEVMPRVQQRWPAYRQTVSRAARHLAGLSLGREQALPVPTTSYSSLGDPGLPLDFLAGSADDHAVLLIRSWLRTLGLQLPDQALLEEFLRQLRQARTDARPLLNTGSYRLQRYREHLYLLPADSPPPEEDTVLAPGQARDIPGVGRVALRRCQGEGIWLAADEELQLCWRDGGERVRLAGDKRSKTLKKVLQEAAVPPWWRRRVPLLYLGQELVAIGAIGACHSTRWGDRGQDAEAPWELVWEATNTACRD
ncbi:tRNA lysidine(34) synthetase TilS [Seongchinamella sediminis]|uniref:tRNA(Ile)-lysidine synthase n=1 Tax=Seongchinamella sediminis TaxID=2283635 RepID=A0A3L7E1K0_9GAMM|nr:tRNA lysidine(34) synthetase TilS [Seongchinamella sediminis]RLQ22765.1 tRNA lysidine(34) synthetase TilS [Seongchinamella sediminis]